MSVRCKYISIYFDNYDHNHKYDNQKQQYDNDDEIFIFSQEIFDMMFFQRMQIIETISLFQPTINIFARPKGMLIHWIINGMYQVNFIRHISVWFCLEYIKFYDLIFVNTYQQKLSYVAIIKSIF